MTKGTLRVKDERNKVETKRGGERDKEWERQREKEKETERGG